MLHIYYKSILKYGWEFFAPVLGEWLPLGNEEEEGMEAESQFFFFFKEAPPKC